MRASTLPLRYFFVGFQAQASKFFIFFIVLSIFQAGPGFGSGCPSHARAGITMYALLNFPLIIIYSFPSVIVSLSPSPGACQSGLLCSILITHPVTHAHAGMHLACC